MRCGKTHVYGRCPAYQEKCHRCLRIGHFSRMCKSNLSTISSTRPQPKQKKKSSKSKQRDMERLQKYKESKSVLKSFPFADLDNDSFVKETQSYFPVNNQINYLKAEVKSLQLECQSKSKETDKEILNLTQENNSLVEKTEDQQSTISNLRQLNNKLLQEISKYKSGCTTDVKQNILDLECQIEVITFENNKLKETVREKESLLEASERGLTVDSRQRELREEIDNLTSELRIYAKELQSYVLKYHCLKVQYDKLQNNYESLQNEQSFKMPKKNHRHNKNRS